MYRLAPSSAFYVMRFNVPMHLKPIKSHFN